MKERICTVKELKEFLDKLPDNTPIYSCEVDCIYNADVEIVDISDTEMFGVECEISSSGRLYVGV